MCLKRDFKRLVTLWAELNIPITLANKAGIEMYESNFMSILQRSKGLSNISTTAITTISFLNFN